MRSSDARLACRGAAAGRGLRGERRTDGTESSIRELLALVRRHLIGLIGIVGFGSAAAVGYALSRPSIYETSAKVLIESQQIPDEMARSTVNLSAAARLQLIEQRLMARESVAALIEKLGLYADLEALSMTRKVGLLRKSTRIESISAPGTNAYNQDAGVVAFTITVSLGDAEQAALVANELGAEYYRPQPRGSLRSRPGDAVLLRGGGATHFRRACQGGSRGIGVQEGQRRGAARRRRTRPRCARALILRDDAA